jgi:hypothetical protein
MRIERIAPRPGLYELALRFTDGREEVRLSDHLDRILRGDQRLIIRGETWQVVAVGPATTPGAGVRLVCEPASALVG